MRRSLPDRRAGLSSPANGERRAIPLRAKHICHLRSVAFIAIENGPTTICISLGPFCPLIRTQGLRVLFSQRTLPIAFFPPAIVG